MTTKEFERDKCPVCLGTGLEPVALPSGTVFWPCLECRGRGFQLEKEVDSTSEIGDPE